MPRYVAIYTHDYGFDFLHFSSNKPIGELKANEVAKKLDVNWEPERGEDMEFFEISSLDFPNIDSKPNPKRTANGRRPCARS